MPGTETSGNGKWKTIMSNPILSAREKIDRVRLWLSIEMGEGVAMRYSGAVVQYSAFGTDDCFPDRVPAGLWEETMKCVDSWDQELQIIDQGAEIKSNQKTSQQSSQPREISIDEEVERLFDPNEMAGLTDRPSSQGRRKYISDVIDMKELKSGKLNLICSPPGTGKTTFIEGPLKRYAENFSQELLYLAPTRSLVKALNHRGGAKKVPGSNGELILRRRQEGITAMTYAAFGSQIARAQKQGIYCEEQWWANDAVICLDELAQAVSQAYYSGGDNVTMYALDELVQRCNNETNIVVTLSATPKRAITFFYFWNKVRTNLIHSTLGLEGYKNHNTVYYYDLNNLLLTIDPNLRGLIYVKRISRMRQVVDLLENRGIHAVAIWSERSDQHHMNEEQIEAVNSVVNEERIPDGVQVLVFNAAYETGLNIRPEKSHVDYVIVNDTNADTVVQARGRYRGDLDTLYQKQKASSIDEPLRFVDSEIIGGYLGIRLDKEAKKRLREDLGFKDERGRLIGWPKLAKELEANGYLVKDGKSGSKRYSIITRTDPQQA